MSRDVLLKKMARQVNQQLEDWAQQELGLGENECLAVTLTICRKSPTMEQARATSDGKTHVGKRSLTEDDRRIIREKLLGINEQYEYDRVRDELVISLGLTKHQVSAACMALRHKKCRTLKEKE